MARRRAKQEMTQPRPITPELSTTMALARLRKEYVVGDTGMARIARSQRVREHVILDLNGQPLFYDVEVADENGVAGILRVAASESIGTSLLSVQDGPRRWDPDAAMKNAQKAAARLVPKATITGTDLVCYCYPKIGVRVMFETGGKQGALLLDAASLEPIERFGGGEPEGETAYSYYAEVVDPTLERRARRFAREQEHMEALRKTTPQLFDGEFQPAERQITAMRTQLQIASVYTAVALLFNQRVLPYSPRCGAEENFRLYAQQTNVYCAVAAGQMILDWHRWYYTQDQIAAAMGTDAGGTGNAGQVAGYESLTNFAFNATYDTSAQWSEAKAEIDAGRPLKSGIPGHARTCNGYRRTWDFTSGGFDYAVRIYDPWPWNANICDGGAVYWEDWDAVTHTNWIYVRHA
jgi:hypothetical protein